MSDNILNKMLNRTQSPFKKVKFDTSIFQSTVKKQDQRSQNTEYLSIVYTNPTNEKKEVLYITPKVCYGPDDKLFHPQDWNISMFQIGRPLGKGKYGHVYLARERSSKNIVAIKALSKKQIMKEDVVNQIRREIQLHTHLDHPNILKMYGFFFDERKIYYIMEYAPGGELYKQLKKNVRFDEKRTARYIKQMANALIHIHKCNIFHRDIKPENILICSGDQLKISDFGWSVRSLSTQRKTMCGTADYICPQIIQNKSYDASVDIWSLGVLTYELSTGCAPFYNPDRHKQNKNIKYVNINYPEFFSNQMVDFISKLLQKDPNNRMRLEQALKHPWIAKNTSQIQQYQ